MTGTEPRRETPPNCRALSACPSPLTLLERALTHRSYAYENGGLPTNERLEFLGDSVLSLVVTDTLFKGHPDLPEGQLAKLRAAVVQMNALAEVARDLRLGSFVRLGRGEEGTGGRDKPSILADTLEAVIGATYIDCGLDCGQRPGAPALRPGHRAFLAARRGPRLEDVAAGADRGPEPRRARVQVKDSGPDHQKLFRAVVKVGSRELGTGEGRSKKAAEQLAAEAAYRSITAETKNKRFTNGFGLLPTPPASLRVRRARATPPALRDAVPTQLAAPEPAPASRR